MSADIDSQSRYHLSRNPDGSLLELETTECSRGYLAFDTIEKRFLAFYILESESSGSRKAMISVGERVYLASEIRHPCVFGLTDYGDYKGDFFYATELIDGERLEPYIERVDALPMAVAIDLGLQLTRLLRYLGDFPRVIGVTDLTDIYVSFTPGQSLRLRMGGLGLNKPETALTEAQICARWIPDVARVLWKIITASLHGKDGRALPEEAISAFLDPFQNFIELLTGGRIRHAADDLFHLEQEFAKYAFEYLNVFQNYLRASTPAESAELRPQAFMAQYLIQELFVSEWTDEDYIFASLLFSDSSNFAVAARDPKRNRNIQFQVMPPDRIKGSGGLGSLHRKMGHPYLMDHPNFVRTYFLRQQDDYLVIGEERVHGFSLAHLMERRGSLLSNEALEIMRKLHWILRQVEGIGVEAEELSPWDVYFQFPPEVSGEAMANLLTGTRLRDWPDFEIKLRVGVTTTDFLRPLESVWPEATKRLRAAFREREPKKEPRNLTFVALAAYMLEYRTYWQSLFAEGEPSRVLTNCSKFNTLAAASVEPTRGEPKDERNQFLREWEARLDQLSLPTDLEREDRLPTMHASPREAAASPFRDPSAAPPDAVQTPDPGAQPRMTVAAAAAAQAASPPRDSRRMMFKPATAGVVLVSLLGFAFGLGGWLASRNSETVSVPPPRHGSEEQVLDPAKLEPTEISGYAPRPAKPE